MVDFAADTFSILVARPSAAISNLDWATPMAVRLLVILVSAVSQVEINVLAFATDDTDEALVQVNPIFVFAAAENTVLETLIASLDELPSPTWMVNPLAPKPLALNKFMPLKFDAPATRFISLTRASISSAIAALADVE